MSRQRRQPVIYLCTCCGEMIEGAEDKEPGCPPPTDYWTVCPFVDRYKNAKWAKELRAEIGKQTGQSSSPSDRTT